MAAEKYRMSFLAQVEVSTRSVETLVLGHPSFFSAFFPNLDNIQMGELQFPEFFSQYGHLLRIVGGEQHPL